MEGRLFFCFVSRAGVEQSSDMVKWFFDRMEQLSAAVGTSFANVEDCVFERGSGFVADRRVVALALAELMVAWRHAFASGQLDVGALDILDAIMKSAARNVLQRRRLSALS